MEICIVNRFNEILDREFTPSCWFRVLESTLLTKDNAEILNNYCPTALINTAIYNSLENCVKSKKFYQIFRIAWGKAEVV